MVVKRHLTSFLIRDIIKEDNDLSDTLHINRKFEILFS